MASGQSTALRRQRKPSIAAARQLPSSKQRTLLGALQRAVVPNTPQRCRRVPSRGSRAALLQEKEPAQQSPGSGHRAFRGLRATLQLGCVAASAGHMRTDTDSWAGAFKARAVKEACQPRRLLSKLVCCL